MIELPRAALTAGRIAEEADFFSFGTNDLTQTTWGFSRDDVEAAFFPQYFDARHLPGQPVRVDRHRRRRPAGRASRPGRARRSSPDLTIGVCGEHGGDPDSIHFFESIAHRLRVLLDRSGCPVARLEAGRATILGGSGVASDSR